MTQKLRVLRLHLRLFWHCNMEIILKCTVAMKDNYYFITPVSNDQARLLKNDANVVNTH